MIKLLTAIVFFLALTGCASIPTEYTSPCACTYEPINGDTDMGSLS